MGGGVPSTKVASFFFFTSSTFAGVNFDTLPLKTVINSDLPVCILVYLLCQLNLGRKSEKDKESKNKIKNKDTKKKK